MQTWGMFNKTSLHWRPQIGRRPVLLNTLVAVFNEDLKSELWSSFGCEVFFEDLNWGKSSLRTFSLCFFPSNSPLANMRTFFILITKFCTPFGILAITLHVQGWNHLWCQRFSVWVVLKIHRGERGRKRRESKFQNQPPWTFDIRNNFTPVSRTVHAHAVNCEIFSHY